MTEQLLDAVRDQIERSDPPVKAAALLHFARVLTAFDRTEAECVLERGIALVPEFPELIPQAAALAATVSPQRALGLMPIVDSSFHHGGDAVVLNMMRHGHLAEAFAFTDGISEAMTADDEEWGEERMQAFAESVRERSAQEILDAIFKAADEFTAGAPQHDDMTLLVFKLER